MGRNNQQRRAAKKRAGAAPQHGAAAPQHGAAAPDRGDAGAGSEPAPRAVPLPAQIAAALEAQSGTTVNATWEAAWAEAFDLLREGIDGPDPGAPYREVDEIVGDLVGFADRPGMLLHGGMPQLVATDRMANRVRQLYEYGWQPADVVHHVQRQAKSAKAVAVVSAAISVEAETSGATARAPQAWLAQLSEGPAPALLLVAGSNVWDGWETVFAVQRALRDVGPLEPLVPPPSKWDAVRAVPVRSEPSPHDPKALGRIRGLLAKAEATDFPEEAETLTAKAQELMARYAIDEVLLIAPQARVDVQARRIHLHDPYANEKASLLHVCAASNHCRSILLQAYGMATLVGPPVELDLTEMLFTSLLVQAVKAMTEAGHRYRDDRSPSFRRAFLVSYAHRIGERLADSTSRVEHAAGAELVPVLARTTAAVDSEFERLYPNSTTGRSRSYDARGWDAGTAAADRARLSKGQVGR